MRLHLIRTCPDGASQILLLNRICLMMAPQVGQILIGGLSGEPARDEKHLGLLCLVGRVVRKDIISFRGEKKQRIEKLAACAS